MNIAKGIAKFHVYNVLTKKKTHNNNKMKKGKHKNPCQSWGTNPRPLASQS